MAARTTVAVRQIRYKQVARDVKGQTLGLQSRRKGGSLSVQSEFIDVAAASSVTYKLPALSKARPLGSFNPEAKVVRTPPE